MSIPDLANSRISPHKCQDQASALTLPTKPKTKHSRIPHSSSFPPPIEESDTPPPLPKRNKHFNESSAVQTHLDPKYVFTDESDSITNRSSKIPKNINSMFLDNEINSNQRQNINKSGKQINTSRYGSQNLFGSKSSISDLQNVLNINLRSPSKYNSPKKGTELKKSNSNPTRGVMVENALYNSNEPPPLPPRIPFTPPGGSDPEPVNSINKQMSYPLVATCATLVNNYVSNSSFYLIFM